MFNTKSFQSYFTFFFFSLSPAWVFLIQAFLFIVLFGQQMITTAMNYDEIILIILHLSGILPVYFILFYFFFFCSTDGYDRKEILL